MIRSLNGQPALIIGDGNYSDYTPDRDYRLKDNKGQEYYTGCLPVEDWDSAKMCSVPWEASGLVIYDEQELKERLTDMWNAKASLMHLAYERDALHQSNGTCWIHGTCTASTIMFDAANLPYRVPSPLSVAAHCYRNFGVRGGYPSLGVEKYQEHGACTTDSWPENANNRRYDNATSQANRQHQVLEEIVETGSGEEGFIKSMSGIAQGKPAGWSFSWWRHYVCGCWGRVDRGELCAGLRNTWGNGWGDRGFSLLRGRKKYPVWSCVFLRMRQSAGG